MGGPVMVIFETEKVTLSAPCPIKKAPLILTLNAFKRNKPFRDI